MNTYLIQKAQERASKSVEELSQKKPISLPSNLLVIKESRLAERELEKIAPLTGYPELDMLVKGFIPGHLYTMTGIENVGKTSMACNFAVRVAIHQKKVLYIALEPDNTVIEYIASVLWDKKFNELTPDDLTLGDLSIDVYSKNDIDSADRLIETVNFLDRYDLIIIDHIGYFITSEKNYLQQQSNTLKQLVGLAKKKQTAVLLIAHLRKRQKSERNNYIPNSNDISGSGAFQQDSTEVFIITRDPKTTDKDEICFSDRGKFYVTKTKVGPNGSFGLQFSERKANILSDELAYREGLNK